jgi:hypothetical protein
MEQFLDWLYIIGFLALLVGFLIWNKYNNRRIKDRKQRSFRSNFKDKKNNRT